jgi:hypothetical protein
MKSLPPGILYNGPWLLGALAFCIYEALPRSMTTFSSSGAATSWRDPMFLFGMIAALFISTMVATRSPLLGDRVVFGVGAASFVLEFVTKVFPPGPSVGLVIGGVESLAWAGAAFTCLLLLIPESWRHAR